MKADTYTETGIPVVRGNNLTGRPGFFGNFVFVSEATASRFARCLVRPGDLVFPHRGAIGEVGLVVEQGFERWMLSTSMMKLRPDPNRLDSRFAFYFFRSSLGRHQLLRNASQVGTPGIGQPLASLRACLSSHFPLSMISMQSPSVLSALDDKIEQNRRTAQALEQLARAIFRAWFVDFEPVKAKAEGATAFPSMPQPVFDALPTGFVDSDIGPVPEGWEPKALSSVCTLVSGGTPKRSEPTYWGGDIPWYSVKDAPGDGEIWVINTSERITEDGVANSASRVVPKGCTINLCKRDCRQAGHGRCPYGVQSVLLRTDARRRQVVLPFTSTHANRGRRSPAAYARLRVRYHYTSNVRRPACGKSARRHSGRI